MTSSSARTALRSAARELSGAPGLRRLAAGLARSHRDQTPARVMLELEGARA